MTKIDYLKGAGIPIKGNDIDTDRIIPARFMKCVTFDGLGEYTFYDVRYNADGSKTDHVMNQPEYMNNNILVVNKNFGCGSSREHAPQSLYHYGIRGIIGESFAEIFAGNCTAMGIPVAILKEEDTKDIQDAIAENPSLELEIDLVNNKVKAGSRTYKAFIADTSRNALREGTWDSTALLLSNSNIIEEKKTELPYFNNYS